ncbi:hypothetical protein MKX03_012590 [Papaver bracteatum]|nr:hypothetical protein MKX03_012590 [Papaver bracteatum]
MVVHSGLPPLHHRLNLFVLILLLIIKFGFFNLALSQKLPEAEVEALEEIAKTIGMKDWNFAATAGPCAVKGVNCSCPHPGNVCHVTGM